MTIILRLQQLPWSATSMDIRRYFTGLSIPDGGVHIVGGDNGDVFIAFSSDEDARRAMQLQTRPLCGNKIALMLSSKNEMQEVIARNRAVSQAKTDPFQEVGRTQSPAPSNQPLITSGGDSSNTNREYAGFKDPSKNQTQTGGQFDPKQQSLNRPLLPSDGPGAGHPPQRPDGDKSLLGLPAYQSTDPALGGHFSDPKSNYGSMFPADRRQGETEKKPLIDLGRHHDVPTGHRPHDVGNFGGNQERQPGSRDEFPKPARGHAPIDMDSRIPPRERPSLLGHEPSRKDPMPPFGSYSDPRGGEGLLDEHHSKRFKGDQEQNKMAPFAQGSRQPEEEKVGKPNIRKSRFDDPKPWDGSLEGRKQGFPDDFKGAKFPNTDGPNERGNPMGPVYDFNQLDPDSRRDQPGPRVGPDGRRFTGDPFGLNDPFDGAREPRDRGGRRDSFDPGMRDPMEQMNPEGYRRGEIFPGSDREQKPHLGDQMGPGDQRGLDHFGPGERRGPGEHRGHDERRGPDDRRGLSEGRFSGDADEHRRRGTRFGPEDRRGPGMDRGRGMGDRRGPESHMAFDERRVPGEFRGPDGRFGPDDPMGQDSHFGEGGFMRQGDRRGPGEFAGPDDRRGPGEFMGPGDRRGPGEFMGPGDRRGVRGPGEFMGPDDRRGPGEFMGLDDRRGPGEFMGLDDRRGPGEFMGPDDRRGPGGFMGPGDRRRPGEFMGPGDRRRPGEFMGPGDRFDPDDEMRAGNRLGPGERIGIRDRMSPGDNGPGIHMGPRDVPADFMGPGDPIGPGDRFDVGGRFGPDDRMGPDSQEVEKGRKGSGRFVSPGPQDHKGHPDHRNVPDRVDPFDHSRQEDRMGPLDLPGMGGRMGQPDNWEPRSTRPSLLGKPGQLGREDIGPRGLLDKRDYRDSRMAPDDFLGSREGSVPGSRLRKESRFDQAGPDIHAQEKERGRDSDMRRGDRGTLPSRQESPLGGSYPASKHVEARNKGSRYVRMSGLPYSVTTAELVKFFSGSEISNNGIRLSVDHRSKPNGNGFIKFVSEEDASKACKLSMKHLGNRYIEVKTCGEADWDTAENQSTPPSDLSSKGGKHSHRSRSRSPIRSHCVELRGLAHHVDAQHIKDFLYGVDVVHDKMFIELGNDNNASGIAYVELSNQQMFERALRKNGNYMGRQSIEVKPILKEVMTIRIADNKKRSQDRRSSSTRDSSNSRDSNSRPSGSRGTSSRDAKYSSPRDRDSRESSSRSSRDQDSRQSSRHGRDSQRSSERESKSRDHDSRQTASRTKDSPKDSGSRSSDSRSRYSAEGTQQKRNGESKDQDSRRSDSSSKASVKDTDSKRQESTPKEDRPKSQQEQAQLIAVAQPKTDASKISKTETLDPHPKQPVESRRSPNDTKPVNPDEKSCISMRNMPFNTVDDEIHKFFEDMNIQPLMVHFLLTPEGRPNGQAYVEFANSADAHKAGTKKDARIRDRSIIMSIITKGHMLNCLAQGKPPPQTPGLLGIPRGPPFPPGNHPGMEFRPPLLGNKSPPFGMRNPPGPMRGPRPPPVEVLIARRCVVETSNLPFDIPIPAIIDFFSNHNVVPESVRLKTSEQGRFCGEAMVAFRSSHDAARAIEDLNHSILGGRVLRLHLMKPM